MKLRKNWLILVVLLLIVSLFLVACERPLPGGYNDPDAGSDTTVPEVPEAVPEVDSEAYPADAQPAAPAEAVPLEAYPADAAQPVEAYPAEEGAADQGLTAEDGEPAADAEVPAEEAADAEAPVEEVTDEAAAEGEATSEEGVAEEAAETPGTHTVATGENLYRIGLLYGINWLDLAEANGIVDPANLTVGQVLTIPGADNLAEEVVETEETAGEEIVEEAVDAEATEDAAAEEVVEEGQEAEVVEEAEAAEDSAQETETAETPEVEDAATPATYIVQAGDTLFSIGVAVGVNWPDIVAANGIIGEQIFPGQELIVPSAADSAGDAEAAEEEADEAETVEPAGEETAYVVQEGDSIYSVAFEHGILWTELVEANNIEAPYTLEVGQTLVIFVPLGE